MFGYIKTYKPEMKIREFDAYKAVYCTLCKQLRKDYGFLARFTLNFDYTFLAMIRIAAKGTSASVKKGRCPFNPLAKCNHVCCEDDSLSYSAAVAMLMFYYKLKDTVADERGGKRFLAYILLWPASRWKKKAANKYPGVEVIIRDFCEQQTMVEQSERTGLDPFCHPTASALSQLFARQIDEQNLQKDVAAVGYNLGKWVYLVDALDDWHKDQKHGRFNPFVRRLSQDVTPNELAEFAEKQLNVCIDEACFAFERLPKRNFYPILHNILFLGLEQVQNEVIGKVKNHA